MKDPIQITAHFVPVRAVMCLLIASLVAGCAGRRGASANDTPPRKIPRVPAPRDVAPDEALAQRARQELLSASRAPDELLRAHAIEAMGHAMQQAVKDQIIAAMKDPEPRVRFAAAMAAGELKLPGSRDAALELVDDPSPSVRIAARFAMHQAGDYSLSHDLEQTAVSDDPNLRGRTAVVLGLMNEPSARKILTPMLRDRDLTVRYQAAESLWRLGDDSSLEYLVAGTLSSRPDDQMFCLLALAAPRRKEVISNVRSGLSADYDEVNLVAARAMGMLGSDEGYGWAVKAVESPETRQRVMAALALGAIGRTDAQEHLAVLLDDSDAHVRVAAAQAILAIHRAAGEA